jgi:2-keto-4-pentenoate hydratase
MEPIKSAAQYLAELRNTGRFGARIPEPFRPATIEDALKIQERIARNLGDPIGGYKCSVPAGERAAVVAPIFAPTIRSAMPFPVRPASPTATDVARIEPEVGFVIGRSLPPRDKPYDEAEVRAAIAETRLLLEILGSRYTDHTQLPFIEQLADCISNQGLFVGPLVKRGLDAPLERFAFRIEAGDSDGASHVIVEKAGQHPDGHPVRPLVWLANFLASRGGGLQAGQTVTTGSYAGAIDVPLDTPLTMTFGELGTIDAKFTRAE